MMLDSTAKILAPDDQQLKSKLEKLNAPLVFYQWLF